MSGGGRVCVGFGEECVDFVLERGVDVGGSGGCGGLGLRGGGGGALEVVFDQFLEQVGFAGARGGRRGGAFVIQRLHNEPIDHIGGGRWGGAVVSAGGGWGPWGVVFEEMEPVGVAGGEFEVGFGG